MSSECAAAGQPCQANTSRSVPPEKNARYHFTPRPDKRDTNALTLSVLGGRREKRVLSPLFALDANSAVGLCRFSAGKAQAG